MMLNYYKQKQLIAKVDEKGNVLGEIEKWEAHKNGILHKAITVTIFFNNKLIIQHRRHPAFDKTYDVTSSSHQLFIKGKLQTSEDTAKDCLKREWNLNEDQYSNLKNLGSIYYKAKDPNSEFTEHEICDVLTVEVNSKPEPNLDFSYDALLVSLEELKNKDSRIFKNLAPWVKVMIEEGKI
jgi:isopentenyl-diphosphate delta-isomerase